MWTRLVMVSQVFLWSSVESQQGDQQRLSSCLTPLLVRVRGAKPWRHEELPLPGGFLAATASNEQASELLLLLLLLLLLRLEAAAVRP